MSNENYESSNKPQQDEHMTHNSVPQTEGERVHQLAALLGPLIQPYLKAGEAPRRYALTFAAGVAPDGAVGFADLSLQDVTPSLAPRMNRAERRKMLKRHR